MPSSRSGFTSDARPSAIAARPLSTGRTATKWSTTTLDPEGRDRIDREGAPRRHDQSSARGHDEQDKDRRVDDRIAWRDVEQHAADRAADCRRADRARNHPGGGEPHALERDEANDGPRLGPERDADANLLRPLDNRVRDDAV